jgi:hypothetical protein
MPTASAPTWRTLSTRRGYEPEVCVTEACGDALSDIDINTSRTDAHYWDEERASEARDNQ